MLPVVKGKPTTRRHIFAYALLLAPLGVAPAFIGLGGILYLAVSAGCGAWLVWESAAVLREKDDIREPAARRLFIASLAYVFLLFAALIAERLIGLAPFAHWI
jgi:protoheme IX farnesyltransferase